MRQWHMMLSNALIMWAARVLLLVPQLVLVPYLIKTIGESGYGVYALVWSLMISTDQLEASLQSGVVKYSAGFLAQGRMDEVNRIVSSSFVYSSLLAVLACTGTLAVAVFYHDPSGHLRAALVVVGIMLLFIVPLTPYVGIIHSRQRYYVGAVAETVSRYISLLAVLVWFRTMGPSVQALIVIMAGMLLLSRLAQVPIAYRLVPGLQNRPSLFNVASFRLIASFGAVTVLASLCLTLNSTGVRWLMSTLLSASFIAHMTIMLMPGLLLSQIIGGVTITVMPATSAYEAMGNHRMLQELLMKGMRYTTMLLLAGLLVLGLLVRGVLSAWVGAHYVFLAPYAIVLSASTAFMLSTSIAHHILKGLGRLRTVVFIYLTGLVILPFVVILAVFWVWKDPYVAITVGLSMGHLVCGCLQIAFGVRAVRADLRRVIWSAYVQPLLVGMIAWPVALSIIAYTKCDGLVERTCMSIVAVLLFCTAVYSLIATTQEREEFRQIVRFAMRRKAAV